MLSHRNLAAALFDFLGFLTTRPETREIGSDAEATIFVELLHEWADRKEVDLSHPNWFWRLSKYPDQGTGRISAERERQILGEGWTPEHDRLHARHTLAAAARCYVSCASSQLQSGVGKVNYDITPLGWPFDDEWWKPDRENPIRNLEKAGALVAAAIDRLLMDEEKT